MGLELRGSVSLDGSGFEAGLRRIESATHMAGETLKSFAMQAFGIYGVEQAIHRTVETAKELVIQSQRLGVTVEQLQVMRAAARENNVEFERLSKALEQFDVAREKILSKSKEGPELMRRMTQLGITEEDLRNPAFTAGQAVLGPLHKAATAMNQEDLGPIFKDIFQKGFGQLIPLFKTNFEELEVRMKKLGAVMSTEAAVQADYLAKEFELLSNIIVSQLAPAIGQFVFWLTSKVGDVKGVAAFAGTMVGAAGGFTPAVADEGRYRRLKAQADLAEQMGMNTPGETRSRGLFRGDAHVPSEAEAAFIAEYERRLDEAHGAKTGVTDDWKKTMDEITKQLAEEMERLKHPKAPTFDPGDAVETSGKQKHEKHIKDSSDSLVRVGNFLGSSRDSMTILAERQVNLLQEIAVNTKPRVDFGEGGIGFPME